MRLKSLYLKEFKNLIDFKIYFDDDSPTSVLVGRNGTGKSNLLEALTIIFKELDLQQKSSIAYEIEYIIRDTYVKIGTDPKAGAHKVLITGPDKSEEKSTPKTLKNKLLLPKFVFGYYSGPSNRMEEHFKKHQENFYRDLIDGKDNPLRPLFYARDVHSQFVLLSFFTKPDEESDNFLKEQLRIEGIDSILFIMREPHWAKKKLTSKQKIGDPRFWNARGTVESFLSKLYKYSLAPIKQNYKVEVGFNQKKSLDHLYLYLTDLDKLREIATQYESQQEFFKSLESTYISELLHEIRIRVKIKDIHGTITFRELSEGEQQILMVLGLLRFTKEDESLFLLDEPDTHLNPAWSLKYMDHINSIVGGLSNSHIIMATHDPLVIAGLEKSQVRIMQYDKEDKVIATEPDVDPKGMGITGLLESDIYGLRAALDNSTLEILDRKRDLASLEEMNEEQRTELNELNNKLLNLGFSKTIRDPLYNLFIEAFYKQKNFNKEQLLSKEEYDNRKKIALEIVDEITSDSKK